MLPLRELQLRFAAALAPEAPPADQTLLGLVRAGDGLGAIDRLAIYADMYRARLLDVLREDFPRTVAVLGEDAFDALGSRYLARHPSTHPSLRQVGGHLAEFLDGEAARPHWLADLARLEWARVEVFDAPDAEPLRLDDLRTLAPAQWPALQLRTIPACAVVDSAWPVHEIWAAGAGDPLDVVRPAACCIRVWREGFSVSHAAMGEAERRVFPLLQRGEPFAALCAELAGDGDPESAAHEAGALLMRWLEDQLLARPPAPCAPS
jgi:hypothetical protein